MEKLFTIYDVISDSLVLIGPDKTAGSFVRKNLPYLSKINANYLSDYIIYEVGTIDDSTCEITSTVKTLIPWDCYKTPEIVAEK